MLQSPTSEDTDEAEALTLRKRIWKPGLKLTSEPNDRNWRSTETLNF